MTKLDVLNSIQKTIALSRRHMSNAYKKVQEAETKMTILIALMESEGRK